MDPFAAYEADFGHDFKVLTERVNRGYSELDAAAHANGSTHDILEFLNVTVPDAGPVRSIRVEYSVHGWISVTTTDTEGTMLSYYAANYADEEPKGSVSGKHRAGEPVAVDSGAMSSVPSQTEQLLIIAGLIEEANESITQGAGQIEVVNH